MSQKIKIQCFTVKKTFGIDTPLQTLLSEFGQNVPATCTYDGCMTGIVDLCCAKMDVDVKNICKKYGYECDSIFIEEVDESQFNSEYRILPTYSKELPHYRLEKNIQT